MTSCEHSSVTAYPKEESRMRGNNYDIVSYRVDLYCNACGTTRAEYRTRRTDISPDYVDLDDGGSGPLDSPNRFGT